MNPQEQQMMGEEEEDGEFVRAENGVLIPRELLMMPKVELYSIGPTQRHSSLNATTTSQSSHHHHHHHHHSPTRLHGNHRHLHDDGNHHHHHPHHHHHLGDDSDALSSRVGVGADGRLSSTSSHISPSEQQNHGEPASQLCDYCVRFKSIRGRTRDGHHLVTLCEVNRHRTPDDCWLVCRSSVYDVSSFKTHPGGLRSFMRRVGGVDSYRDFMFHSSEGKRTWAEYLVGKLVPCVVSPGEGETEGGEGGAFASCVIS